MNRRIQELAEQAAIDTSTPQFSYMSFQERFAELIVKECCKISDWVERTDQPVLTSRFIKANFGVEE